MAELPRGGQGGFIAARPPDMGTWVFVVAGGPVFGATAVLALRVAASEAPADSARKDILERLAMAAEAALDG